MALEFIKLLDALAECIGDLPRMVGTEAVNFSKERFVQQNWYDTAPIPWPKRKHDRRGGEKRQQGAVLVDSGRLKRSIRIVSVSPSAVVIGTDVPYAQMHNDGFKGEENVKAHPYHVKARTEKVKEHQRKMKIKYKDGTEKEKTVTVKAHKRHVKAHIKNIGEHTRKMDMPRRRFLGESAELNRRIEKLITDTFVEAIKNASTPY